MYMIYIVLFVDASENLSYTEPDLGTSGDPGQLIDLIEDFNEDFQ